MTYYHMKLHWYYLFQKVIYIFFHSGQVKHHLWNLRWIVPGSYVVGVGTVWLVSTFDWRYIR
jgi:hypothetical protein